MRLGEVGSDCSAAAPGCGRFGCGRSGKLCVTCGAKSRLGGGRIRAIASRCRAAGGCGEAGGCGGVDGCRGGQAPAMISGGCQAAGGCGAPGGCGGIGGCRGGLMGGNNRPYGGDIPHVAENPMMGPGGQVPQYVYPYYTTRGPRDFLNTNPPGIGY